MKLTTILFAAAVLLGAYGAAVLGCYMLFACQQLQTQTFIARMKKEMEWKPVQELVGQVRQNRRLGGKRLKVYDFPNHAFLDKF